MAFPLAESEVIAVVSDVSSAARSRPRIAYLSLQAVEEGQDSWAAVKEIIVGWERSGWVVDRYFVRYPPDTVPGALARVRAMRRIQRELSHHLSDYDALYVRGHPMAYSASRAAQKRGIPVIQECNGTYEDLFVAWPVTRYARPLFEGMMRRQYREAALIFCGTEQQRAWLRSETGHERIVVSPNGANHLVFRPDFDKRPGLPERYVVFFGQFAPWQGIEVLIAARRSSRWPSGVGLVFAGDGILRPAVEEAVARSDGGIIYLGRLPYEELPSVIAHSVASTSPQFTAERGATGFSALKLYESMACGVPVIGSDYPGVGDVIRQYDCGLVVPPGDSDALAEAVASLVADPTSAKEMGRRGRAAVEAECSWHARAEQRRTLIEGLLGAKTR